MKKQILNESQNSALRKTDVSRSFLSYEEATALSLKTKWKVTPCNSGEECWCRLIVPETEIEDKDGNEIYIAGSGCIPKVYAEHIVKLHNESLLINKKQIIN